MDRLHPYVGTEQYTHAYEALVPNDYDCVMEWNTQGVASSTTCVDCTFAFDLTLTYDSTSVNNGRCDNLAVDQELTYGFIQNYDDNGHSALLIYDPANASWTHGSIPVMEHPHWDLTVSSSPTVPILELPIPSGVLQ